MDISSIIGAYGAQQTNDLFSIERKSIEETSKTSVFDSQGDTITFSQEARDLAMQMQIAADDAEEEEELEQELLEKSLQQAAELRRAAEEKTAAEAAVEGIPSNTEDKEGTGSMSGGGIGGGSSSSSDQIEKLERQITQISSQLEELTALITPENFSMKSSRITTLQSQLAQLQQQLMELKSASQA